MERTPAKRSSLFLLELMIAILFFCLASAVCVQIFVKAHTTSRETQELNTALEKSGEQPEEIYSVETDRMTGTERE